MEYFYNLKVIIGMNSGNLNLNSQSDTRVDSNPNFPISRMHVYINYAFFGGIVLMVKPYFKGGLYFVKFQRISLFNFTIIVRCTLKAAYFQILFLLHIFFNFYLTLLFFTNHNTSKHIFYTQFVFHLLFFSKIFVSIKNISRKVISGTLLYLVDCFIFMSCSLLSIY